MYDTFCRETLKYDTFCRETLKYDTFCRETLKYGTFCRKNLDYALRAKKNGKFAWRADSTFYATLSGRYVERTFLKVPLSCGNLYFVKEVRKDGVKHFPY